MEKFKWHTIKSDKRKKIKVGLFILIFFNIFSCAQNDKLYLLDFKQYVLDNDLSLMKKYNFSLNQYLRYDNWNLDKCNSYQKSELLLKQFYYNILTKKQILIKSKENQIIFYNNIFSEIKEVDIYYYKKQDDENIELYTDKNLINYNKTINMNITRKRVEILDNEKKLVFRRLIKN